MKKLTISLVLFCGLISRFSVADDEVLKACMSSGSEKYVVYINSAPAAVAEKLEVSPGEGTAKTLTLGNGLFFVGYYLEPWKSKKVTYDLIIYEIDEQGERGALKGEYLDVSLSTSETKPTSTPNCFILDQLVLNSTQ